LRIFRNKMDKDIKEKLDRIIELLEEIAENTGSYT
jgi:hypothetical protein